MNKKILSIFLVLSILASMLSFVSVFADGDVIFSYSFEDESEGWSYYKENAANTLSTAQAKDGKQSLYINDDAEDLAAGFTSPYIEAVPGETYTVTADVYSVKTGGNFYLRFTDAAKKKLEDKTAKPSKTGEWVSLTATGKAPEGAKYVQVLAVTFLAGGAEMYYDNVVLKGKTADQVAPAPAPSTGATTGTTTETTVQLEGTKFPSEIGFLAKLGLIDSNFKWDAEITKGEMAMLIAKALHPDVDFTYANGPQVFTDVPATHQYYAYIKACKDLKIVNGDYEGKFYPENKLSVIEALTITINALGYTPYAEAFGGYPTGYFTVASQSGLSKGVSAASSATVTGEIVAKIIYNALFADLVQLKSIANGNIEIEINNGKNILSERLGIYEFDAIVIDNGISSIYGSSINDPEMTVIEDVKTGNRVTAYVNDSGINGYLGYRVKAFVKNNMDNGKLEYIFTAPYSKAKTVTINAKDIFNVSADYVEYDEDLSTSAYDKISLGGFTPLTIVNGVRVVASSLSDVIPADGIVTFIENNGDSKFDVVNILSFNYANGNFNGPARNIFVDSISTVDEEHSISCAFNPAQSLDLAEEEAGYAFTGNDAVKSIKDLKPGMIVSVAEAPELIDGKPYYFLVASNVKLAGTLNGKGDNALVMSDGNEYDLSTSITSVKASFMNYLNLGKNITIYIDITGNIAYAENEGGNAKNYAYIVKAVERTQGGEKVALVKFFDKAGKMQELVISEKAKIDGEYKSTIDSQIAAINTRSTAMTKLNAEDGAGRPAIIEVKDDKIIRIDTDTPNASLASGTVSKTYATQTPIQYSEEDADSFETLKAGFRSPRLEEVIGTTKNIGGKFYITNNTVVIGVPEIDTYGLQATVYNKYKGGNTYQATPNTTMIGLYEYIKDDSNYKALKASNLNSRFLYDIQGYDIDGDTGVAGLVVVRGRTDAYYYGSNPYDSKTPMLVFSRKTTVYDAAKEKEVTKIYYYENGKEQSGTIDLEDAFYPYVALINGCAAGYTPYAVAVPALEEGDIIRVVKSGTNITHIERVVDISNYGALYAFTLYPSNARDPYSVSKSGLQSNANADGSIVFPFDMRPYRAGTTQTYTVGSGWVDQIKGSIMRVYTAKSETSADYAGNKLAAFDPNDPAKIGEQYLDVAGIVPMVIDIDESGEITVKEGTLNDIKTLQEENNVKENSSVIYYKHTNYKMEQIVVINGIENAK